MTDPVTTYPPPESFLVDARAHGLVLESDELERLGRYLALLLDANRSFNLTAVTDPDEAWTRHVLDSLTLLPYLLAARAERVIDVGSGGGLPGLPLAIVRPEAEVTLLEATGKKAAFLERAARTLDLSGVRVVNERAETAGRDPAHRERYDVVVARAVGRLPVLLELTLPLARVGGHVLAIKGAAAREEVAASAAALEALGAEVAECRRTPTGTVVAVDKRRRTSPRYPRRPGEPKRAPIGDPAARG